MAINRKDIETLWGRYQSEGVSKRQVPDKWTSTVELGYSISCQPLPEQRYENRPSQAGLCRTSRFHSKTRFVMFNLAGATRYKYIPNCRDMRGGNDKLSGIVRSLGENPEDGTAYVFMSKDQKLVKVIRLELLQGMSSLLDSNIRIGQELSVAGKDLNSVRDDLENKKIGILESDIKYLKDKQNASNRHRFGDKGENNSTVSEKFHQALKYMINNWLEHYGYVNTGNVLIDNNCRERTVRPFTNLRKNFGGFSSEAGAVVAATYLTFVETCKLMKKTALDFFKGFFYTTLGGKTDYELITQKLLC